MSLEAWADSCREDMMADLKAAIRAGVEVTVELTPASLRPFLASCIDQEPVSPEDPAESTEDPETCLARLLAPLEALQPGQSFNVGGTHPALAVNEVGNRHVRPKGMIFAGAQEFEGFGG